VDRKTGKVVWDAAVPAKMPETEYRTQIREHGQEGRPVTQSSGGLGRGLWTGILTLSVLFCVVLILLGAYAHARISAAGERPGDAFRKTNVRKVNLHNQW
jgi:hypothetical protein